MNNHLARALLTGGIAAVVVAAIAVLLAQRSGGGPSGEAVPGVLRGSLEASALLESYEIQVDGEVEQAGKQARFRLTYEYVAPDGLRWLSESESPEGAAKTGLLVMGNRWWGFDGDNWEEETPLSTDLSAFSAERIWALVPFDSARARSQLEDVNSFKARHFEAEKSGSLSLEILAGSLLAGEEPTFDGDLTSFTIDFWTDETAGYPVQMKLVATGSDRRLTLNARLVRVNDPSIKIEPPEGARPLSSTAAPVATSFAPQQTAPANTAPATVAPQPATQQPATIPSTAAPPAPNSPAAAAPLGAAAVQPQSMSVQATQAAAPLPRAGSGGLMAGHDRAPLLALGLTLTLASIVLLVWRGEPPGARTGPAAARRTWVRRGP